ncbi:hypothetical protein QYE76_048389 [Lolium multiflorum]|uniref:CCHC-type domain-containing protein n=1 Tax=Lolium multiflorum TaxID=4521 RepID=A0AAD8SLS9_LOLMU|nr:hypothetical protein QYE76_048389 [Lolium multiflorum]
MSASDEKIVNQKNKNFADVMTWREYEALRNEMRREFRSQDDELRGTVHEISQKLDATNETVTTMQDQMTDIQHSLQVLHIAVDNLTQNSNQKKKTLSFRMKHAVLVVVLDVVTVVVALLNSELAVSLHNNKTMVWYDIKGIVRHHSYTTMNELLHHAREAEAQLAEEAQIKGRATGAGRYTPRAPPSRAPVSSSRSTQFPTSSSKPVSNVSITKKSEPAASTSGSSMSTVCNCDMACHTCGGKGHFKRDCPNCKVMFINEDNEYETGDDADPYAPEDDDYDSDGVDGYQSEARIIVVSQRALNVLPSASTQRYNLFQTKALVDPDKA